MSSACVFCERIELGDVLLSNEHAAAFEDGFPISPGHTLIVPRRHEADLLALAEEEQAAIWSLIAPVRQMIEAQWGAADGYNIGVNIGTAAGQTIAHAHLHLIPRWHGDVADPRGGVRWVVPSKAAYWKVE
jgi:diadenosine tetraphosphate (Ap4A) HIT family hydrolase